MARLWRIPAWISTFHWAKGRQFPPMTTLVPTLRPLARRPALLVAVLALLVLLALALGQALVAQVEGDRGIAPVAATNDISVGGIKVDVTGDNPRDAREKGWKLAQRKGWEKLGGSASISEADLEDMVSAITIEHEELGTRRYIATLGVVFNRAKAAPLLGTTAAKKASAPMLTIPVLRQGGTYTVYEMRNDWQQAWAQFQPGTSPIDYVRPSGAGGESLLLNFGQIGRRSRSWWRTILDQFGAADILVPVAELRRQWPGGPVTGTFTARYGPDDTYLDSFKLTAPNDDAVPDMLNTAVKRFDSIYGDALAKGLLRPDPTLNVDTISVNPTIAALIQNEQQIRDQQEQAANQAAQAGKELPVETVPETPAKPAVVTSYIVQFATPDGQAVDAALASVRGTPGVRGAATSSIAIGGVSVMRVSYGGSMGALANALRSRGWNVSQGNNVLSISR
jgi:hypothetical protein